MAGVTASKYASFELSRPRAVLFAVVGALVVNIAIWLIGAAAGGSFEFTNEGETMSAAPGGVIILTVVPMVVGLTAAALLSYLWLPVIRVAQVVGSLAALATIVTFTIPADLDGTSTVALSAMHVVLVPAIVLGLEAMRNRIVVTKRP